MIGASVLPSVVRSEPLMQTTSSASPMALSAVTVVIDDTECMTDAGNASPQRPQWTRKRASMIDYGRMHALGL